MKEKKDCKIVQDLLPNYIEKLTSEETNKYIEEHLKECEDCCKVMKEMGATINIETEKYDNRKVNFLKKYKKRLKLLTIILLSIILIFVVLIGRKAIILAKLFDKNEELSKKTNFYTEFYSVNPDGTTQMIKAYINGEDHLATVTKYLGNTVQEVKTFYKKGDDELFLIERGEEKLNIHNQGVFSINLGTIWDMPFIECLHIATRINIKNVELNGKKCYLIKSGFEEIYVDSETGLSIKYVYKSNGENYSTDKYYKLDVVKDEDIVKPDTTGFKERSIYE